MIENLIAKLAPIQAERDTLAKQISELQTQYEDLDAKRNISLQDSLQTISDEECLHIENCLFRLFKIYHGEDAVLAKARRNKFSVTNSQWDDGRITFTICVRGVGEYSISEHPAVFSDIETYVTLRKQAFKTNKSRTKIRAKSEEAAQRVTDFLDKLKPII